MAPRPEMPFGEFYGRVIRPIVLDLKTEMLSSLKAFDQFTETCLQMALKSITKRNKFRNSQLNFKVSEA
jgi:hypothetical protein